MFSRMGATNPADSESEQGVFEMLQLGVCKKYMDDEKSSAHDLR